MGSDANGTRRRAPPVNGLAKEAATQPVTAPPKLLTLPTLLTIGRVAAVPFLISSKFPHYDYY
jgi:CDP-diacylglycerol--glycerol-3-phosphate 3-phosphatidyltransferase